ncbi:hypothetical protein ACJW31_03G065900 [Castanea mollissima]
MWTIYGPWFMGWVKTSPISNMLYRGVSSIKDDVPVHGLSEVIVGVLGGGQLGHMLCQAALQMAIKVMVLDPLENCPASALSYHHMVGSFDDSATVREFEKRCDVLTVEIEHVDVATMEMLEQQGVDCQPKASTIRIIQEIHSVYKITKVDPCGCWCYFRCPPSLNLTFSFKYFSVIGSVEMSGVTLFPYYDLEGPKRAGELFGYPLMKRLAYDGHRNAAAHSEEELFPAVAALGGFDRGLYVEKWATFVTEMAVIVARGRDNSIFCYSVVETIHKKHATDVAYKAVSSLEGTGVFAILLNEVAHRPHNSGHHTIESCYTSQFEQHLRAVVSLPLGEPSMKTPAAVVYNILAWFYFRALSIPGATVHWYDKPGIRMGHVTIGGPSMGDMEERLKSILKEEGSDCQSAVTPRVGIIMGSDSDLPVMKDAARILNMFGAPYEVKIVSAHRTPEMMISYASSALERGIILSLLVLEVQPTCQASMVAALTPLPVIGVPVRASALDGLDSLLSIVQMPRGVPVATVAINNATNAGFFAVRMMGIRDADLLARMSPYQEDTRNDVLRKAEKLEKDGWESYLNP